MKHLLWILLSLLFEVIMNLWFVVDVVAMVIVVVVVVVDSLPNKEASIVVVYFFCLWSLSCGSCICYIVLKWLCIFHWCRYFGYGCCCIQTMEKISCYASSLWCCSGGCFCLIFCLKLLCIVIIVFETIKKAIIFYFYIVNKCKHLFIYFFGKTLVMKSKDLILWWRLCCGYCCCCFCCFVCAFSINTCA